MLPLKISCVYCNDDRELKKGNILSSVQGLKLLIVGIPHYYCYTCNSIAFPESDKVVNGIKFAVKNQYNVILWDN